jgi:hypothetical protein
MPASDPARPTRLIVTLAAEGFVAEIRNNGDGEHRIAITRWKNTASGPRQQGRSAEFPVAGTSRITALVDAVRKAIAENVGCP